MPFDKMGNEYTVISSFSLSDPENKVDSKAVFGYGSICYVSQKISILRNQITMTMMRM